MLNQSNRETNRGLEAILVRLRTINVFSAYTGETDTTKARTKLLRADSDFLDYEYACVVKYCNNDFCKQLNIACDENASEMFISEKGLDGYPTISIPFDFLSYQKISPKDKKLFWVSEIKKVFHFLFPMMNCDTKKIEGYIEMLFEKYQGS